MEGQKKRCCQCNIIVDDYVNFCPDCGGNQFEWVDKDITMELRPEDSPWHNQEISNITGIQNKTKSNKLKIIILAVVLIIMFGGPLMIMLSDISNNDSDISNQVPKVEYTKGEIIGNSYSNEWADISIEFPTNYTNAPEKMYMSYENDTTDCCMYFVELNGESISIVAEDISIAPTMTEKRYMEEYFKRAEEAIVAEYSPFETKVSVLVKDKAVEIAGHTFYQLSYQINFGMDSMSFTVLQNMYLRKIEDRMLLIAITTETNEEAEYLISLISAYDEKIVDKETENDDNENITETEIENIDKEYIASNILSDDIDSFQVQIMDEVYQFPVNYDDFVATGWKVYEKYNSIDQKIKSGFGSSLWFEKNGMLVCFYVFNPDISIQSVEGCVISGISTIEPSQGKERTIYVYIPGAFKVGETSKEQILEACREPDNIYESDTLSILTFQTDNIYANTKLKFDGNGILCDISLENPVAAKDYQYSGVDTTYVAEYTVPTSMGDKITDRIVNFDGDLYQLPVTVNALMENGWTLVDAQEIVRGGGYSSIDLERNGVSFWVIAKNYSDYAVEVTQCYIEDMSSSDVYKKQFEISGGIHMEMTEDELKEILNNAGIEYATETSSSGILYGFNIGKDTSYNYVHIKFSNGKVEYIVISAGKEWRK